jgi:hypothetical protein
MTHYSDPSISVEFPDSFTVVESFEGSCAARDGITTLSVAVLPQESLEMLQLDMQGNALNDSSEFSIVKSWKSGFIEGVYQTHRRPHPDGVSSQIIFLLEIRDQAKHPYKVCRHSQSESQLHQ